MPVSLEDRVAELEATVRSMKAQAQGEPGRDGKDGRDGRNAKSINPAQLMAALRGNRSAPQIHVEPAAVQPQFNVAAPVVHVAAPTVNVEAQPAPVVNVDAPVTVNLPQHKPRRIKFDEDKNGNITGATLNG